MINSENQNFWNIMNSHHLFPTMQTRATIRIVYRMGNFRYDLMPIHQLFVKIVNMILKRFIDLVFNIF